MSARKVVGKCEACGAELHAAGAEYWEGADYCELPLAPGVTALVCAKDLGHHGASSRQPKGPCARRVRQKRALCPGCGKSSATDMTYAGVLCDDCEAVIARARDTDGKKVSWHSIVSAGLVPYLGSEQVTEAARALAEAVAGGRRWFPRQRKEIFVHDRVAAEASRVMPSAGSLSDPIVEMDETQAAALTRFLDLVYEVMQAERERGFEEGDNLLRRLAKGDVRPDEYEQWGPKGPRARGG